jgi:hypothetical protein
MNERVQPANFFPNERMLAISNDSENAPASANPVACCGVSERITIKWIISLHFEIINWTPH